MTATGPDEIEQAMRRARAELHLAPARVARRHYLQDLAARHHVTIGDLPIDDELAVQRAAHSLGTAGVPVDWDVITIPTADQYLAGHPIHQPPSPCSNGRTSR